MRKRINLVLQSGIFLTEIKLHKVRSHAVLYLTDYNTSTRILIDYNKQDILLNIDNVAMSEADMENILKEIKLLINT